MSSNNYSDDNISNSSTKPTGSHMRETRSMGPKTYQIGLQENNSESAAITRKDFWDSPYHKPTIDECDKSISPQSQEINSAKSEVLILLKQIGQFQGTKEDDKDFRYIDEMLTRCILKLDSLDCNNLEIRNERRQTINKINHAISILERRLSVNMKIHQLGFNLDSNIIECKSSVSDPALLSNESVEQNQD